MDNSRVLVLFFLAFLTLVRNLFRSSSYMGNLIGRGIVEFCEGRPPVKNFISRGGLYASSVGLSLCAPSLILSLTQIYSWIAQDKALELIMGGMEAIFHPHKML